jgi:hypothetical protein
MEKDEKEITAGKEALKHLKEFLKENWKVILTEVALTTFSFYLKRRKGRKKS